MTVRKLLAIAGTAALFSMPVACQTAMPPPLLIHQVDRAAIVKRAAGYGLVPVTTADSSIRVDARYANASNAFGQVLYPPGFPILVSEPTARKLAAANAALRPHKMHLVVLDAYRPPEVQWQIYQLFQSDKYVADPRKKWSKHCYGRAADLTMADSAGHAAAMPSEFDDFTEKASATYTGGNSPIRKNLALLQKVMVEAGFSLYDGEWWHFNDLSDPAALTGKPVFGKDLGLWVRAGKFTEEKLTRHGPM